MNFVLMAIGLTAALAMVGPRAAIAAGPDVVIGDVDDMSGALSDNLGMGGVEAIKMAIADFGGTVLGHRIVVVYADHQNKPDIAVSKAREWADQNGLNMLFGGTNTGAAIAISKVMPAKKVPLFITGASGASLTNEDCTAYTVHYVYNTTALANGTAATVVKSGGNSWFYLTADYAFGTQLQSAASKVVESSGGKNVGAVRVPLQTSDFSSFVLQAQSSGAQVLALANAGTDFINSLKAAHEFGLTKTMKPVGLVVFIPNIHSLGLDVAQGLTITTAWYWDLNDETRAFSKRYQERTQKPPTMAQAGTYSATRTYLNAVKAAGTTDADKVMAELKRTKINDMFAKGGYIRGDGLMIHSMYVMQVKSPQESKYPWDYYKVVKVMSGEDAFGPITGLCPLAPSSSGRAVL
jgi:branched-chain amino acid transport system substrate-binding protein